MTDIERIKQEIKSELSLIKVDNDFNEGRWSELNHLLLFVDNIEEKHYLIEATKEVLKDKDNAKQFLLGAGIMDKDGNLAEEYRTEEPVRNCEICPQSSACALGEREKCVVENHVSERFEKAFISMVDVTHENSGSYSLHEFAQRLFNIAKDDLKEPISEDLEEAAEDYGIRQGAELKPFAIKYFKAGAKWQKEQKDSITSDDLEEEIKRWVYDPCFDLNGVAVKGATDYLTVEDVADIARHFAKWQKEKDEGIICDVAKQTKEAYLLGKAEMREQMMKDAADFTIVDIDEQNIELSFFPPRTLNIGKEGDKLKVIFIKEN